MPPRPEPEAAFETTDWPGGHLRDVILARPRGVFRIELEGFKMGSLTPPTHALYVRLCGELERIHSEVYALVWNRHIFWKVQEILRENKSLRGKPRTFNKWMAHMYCGASAGAVRRLIDRRKDSISFVRLLNDVKKNSACFSREQYKIRFANPQFPPGYLDRDYDTFIGRGKNRPEGATIESEIAELQRRTDLLKEYVDERVAHAAREQNSKLPTFQHLDDAIDYLDQLVTRYLHLFRGSSMRSVLPIELYDWTEIFRHAWIEES